MGKQALAGVGVTTPVILAISAFAALVSMGGASKASIFLGKGENEQAERVVGSCTWMLLLLSVLLTGIMLAFGRPILLLFGASADTILFASDYMNIYCLGTVFTQLTLGLNAFITAQGKTLVSMGNVAVGAATNIVLDAVLINGFHMGVKGAALATIISQGVSACFVIRYLCSGKSVLRLRLRNISFDGKHLWPCILLGTSPALMQLTENLVAISFNTSLQIYGGDMAVAAIFTNDAALIAYTIRSMRIYLAALLIYGVQVACQYSFVALDQAPKAIFLTIWRKIILLIPLIFLLPHFWPDAVMGVYLAEAIADTIAVCTTAPMFYVYYRKLK